MKILIAEDNNTDRLILRKIVENQGHQVFEATNGKEAVEIFDRERPGIILLDVIMPAMDGFDVARHIKGEYPDLYTPIIFITSLTETRFLVKCIEVGGDDFFTKPFNQVTLQAKINAFIRAKNLYETVVEQKQKLEFHSQHLLQEQRIAKRIFDNIAHKGALGEPYIKFSVSPMSIFNGDILLAAKRPLGGVNIFLGDFTGHGLAASIGALPVSELFYSMTAQGYELSEIISEINDRLCTILPTGYFCCAVAAEIDFELNRLKFWNGGLPESFVVDQHSDRIQELNSKHLPLGILAKNKYEINIDIRSFDEGESLFVYSDGVIEVENAEGDLFGRERLLTALKNGSRENRSFESVAEAVKRFKSDTSQGDDITYIEVKNHKDLGVSVISEVDEVLSDSGPNDSEISLCLGPKSLKNYNPMPLISQHLMEIGNLRSYRSLVFTVLSELYSNALEHGVLELSSSLKQSAEGFTEYYRRRQEKLEQLEHGFIKLKLKHENTESGGRLTIECSDSGKGFDFQSVEARVSSDSLSGRGFPIVYRLADQVTFGNNGSYVKVVFSWKASRDNKK